MAEDDKVLGETLGIAQYIRDRVGIKYTDDVGPIVTSEALKRFGFTPEATNSILDGKDSIAASNATFKIEKLLEAVDSKGWFFNKEGQGEISKSEWDKFAAANLSKDAPQTTTEAVPAHLLQNPAYGFRGGRES